MIEQDEKLTSQLAQSLPLTNVDDVQNTLGNKGAGATICIIDTEIYEGSTLAGTIVNHLLSYTKKGVTKYSVYNTKKNTQGKINYMG